VKRLISKVAPCAGCADHGLFSFSDLLSTTAVAPPAVSRASFVKTSWPFSST
jgi:hypothetical protein